MNNTWLKCFCLAASASTAVVAVDVTPAQAWRTTYCVNCATRYTQATEVAKAIETAVNTARQLQTQIQQYQDMLQQGLSLDSTELGSVSDSISDLNELYQQGQNMAGQMTGFTSDFSDQYKDFDTFLTEAGGDPAALKSYYGEWSDQTSMAARTAMQSSGMNINQIGGETDTLNELVAQSQSAEGRMQAIQAGNQISAMMVQQMQKMRVMVNDQIQAQNVYQAQVAAESAATKAADDTALGGQFANSGARAY